MRKKDICVDALCKGTMPWERLGCWMMLEGDALEELSRKKGQDGKSKVHVESDN